MYFNGDTKRVSLQNYNFNTKLCYFMLTPKSKMCLLSKNRFYPNFKNLSDTTIIHWTAELSCHVMHRLLEVTHVRPQNNQLMHDCFQHGSSLMCVLWNLIYIPGKHTCIHLSTDGRVRETRQNARVHVYLKHHGRHLVHHPLRKLSVVSFNGTRGCDAICLVA